YGQTTAGRRTGGRRGRAAGSQTRSRTPAATAMAMPTNAAWDHDAVTARRQNTVVIAASETHTVDTYAVRRTDRVVPAGRRAAPPAARPGEPPRRGSTPLRRARRRCAARPRRAGRRR